MNELENLKAVIASVELGIWNWEILNDKISWSDELFRLFGLEVGDGLPTYAFFLSLLPPEDRVLLNVKVENALRMATEKKESTRYTIEHRIVLPNGAERWIEGRGIVIVDADGKPVRITGTALDISERKHTAEQLRKSEEIHRIFSQLASDYVYVVDLSNPTLFPEIVGGSFERTTGMTPAEVQAKGGWLSILHPDDKASMLAIVPTLMAGKPSINEYRITDGSGHIRWLRDAVHPMTDPQSGKVVKLMGGVQDITERKRLEEQLLQAQKLEAVARLSGGIAHDFNNLLSVVMGSVAMLETEVHSDSARESCNAILEASIRGADLTRSMLIFSRRDAGTPRLVNLNEVVRDAMPMLARAVGPRITWKLKGSESQAMVRIDAGQAQLLLLNLTVNARDAMPDGGCISINLHSQRYGSGDELPGELNHGPYVRLSVSDEGVGIEPDILSHVFEPFFTTKAHGKGTGLGLAACQNVVGHANGAIHVTSLVGKGTTFTIFLPLSTGEKSKTVTSPAQHSPGGMERILLVEDEKPLQEILVRNLRDRGYTIISVDSAEEAILKLKAESFALLITDLVLPRMHGSELVRQVRAIQPGLLMLCISGYPGDSDLPTEIPLLSKPFTMERLAFGVRAVLDGNFDSSALV